MARAVTGELCIGDAPGAQEARRKGGAATSRAARAAKLIPSRLRPVAVILEAALTEVHDGTLSPNQGTAIASLAGALIRVVQAGEMEERLRSLEARVSTE